MTSCLASISAGSPAVRRYARTPLVRCVFRRVFVLTTCLFFTTTLLFMHRAGGPVSDRWRHLQAAATLRQLQGTDDLRPEVVAAADKQQQQQINRKWRGSGGGGDDVNNTMAIDAVADRKQLVKLRTRMFAGGRQRPPDSAYNLNATLSDLTPLDRDVIDSRPRVCWHRYPSVRRRDSAGQRRGPAGERPAGQDRGRAGLPRVSVVIPFYDESLSMLLRTVHSVLGRTPSHLLEEVILVDDYSTHADLQRPLEEYLALLPGVVLLRNAQRQGLIRSRMRGADAAHAGMLVFLDAHTEVNAGWVEPLLEELVRHPDTVVQPFIDGIDVKTLEYSRPGRLYRGTFSWDLRYVWVKIPDHMERTIEEDGTPYPASTLVGCAIAVNKTYFYSIGAFDLDQKIWGGENIELAFRVWMCGGGVTTVPCSRVGHAFRPLPYSIEGDHGNPWQKNLMRVADTWMGDFARYFYSSTRIYENRRVEYSPEELVSLRSRKQLRTQLNCRTFEWYMTNVAHEIPLPPRDALMHGEVTNYHTHACWEVLDDGYLAMSYVCYEHRLIPENIFTVSRDGQLLYRDRCVSFLYPKPLLRVLPCPETPNYKVGKWHLKYKDQARWAQVKVTLELKGHNHTWCVMQVTSAVEVHRRHQMPQTAECDDNSMFQFWAFSYRFDYKD